MNFLYHLERILYPYNNVSGLPFDGGDKVAS